MSDHKINLQARIKRHSRILKDNLGNSLVYSKRNTFGYKIIALFMILLFPIYPVFSYFGTTQESFYRGDIDESSILESYDLDSESDLVGEETLFESKDSFLSIGTLVEDDNSSSNKMIEYNVVKGDRLELIAQKYNVSEDTIIWANNINTKNKELKEGIKLIFPPVTGIVYNVKSGDNISSIAKKYSVYTKNIVSQNNLTSNNLKISQKLVIPGGKYIKEIEKPIYVAKTYSKKTSYKPTQTYKKPSNSYISKASSVKGMYPLKWRKNFSGAWGNCTYYVASYKNVNWRGNANQWMRNAKAKGHATGMSAVNGSIVVLGGKGYNRRYGHVAIIREVGKDYLIVSDMNYRRLNQITVRKIKRYGSHIKGYIYVGD
ncbi:MAG: LysM peptidoglycan-binding domain-containing protein [Candidatus Gracilibacteria bacterium]|nr:LysM peptidoglycan-binding domain-containing protein [Candidatus Gracilibacteria bacterium]MDQ7022929.1 LysM peptidoglycan-binding domain-containing protein [Candidatus Gracilibacteria bacterium]